MGAMNSFVGMQFIDKHCSRGIRRIHSKDLLIPVVGQLTIQCLGGSKEQIGLFALHPVASQENLIMFQLESAWVVPPVRNTLKSLFIVRTSRPIKVRLAKRATCIRAYKSVSKGGPLFVGTKFKSVVCVQWGWAKKRTNSKSAAT